MELFRIRSDLPRVVQDGYAFPLGIVPAPGLIPSQGYSVHWHEGEGDLDEPCYTFHVVLSLERLVPLLNEFFGLLPERDVYGIMELGSRDAFRTVDIYLGERGIPRDQFLDGWKCYEPIFLEDASLSIGVNAEDPFVEVFLDPDKGLLVHVDPELKDSVEGLLADHGVEEVPQAGYDMEPEDMERIGIRPILVEGPDLICDMDQLLQELKYDWFLVLDEDPTVNLDGRGRRIGRTLWHAVVILESRGSGPMREAHATIWGTATSRQEMEQLIRHRLDEELLWDLRDFYAMDRAAYDDRPDDLDQLPPRPEVSKVHLLQIDPMDASSRNEPHG